MDAVDAQYEEPGRERWARETDQPRWEISAALRDIVDVLTDAEPADKAELYDELGVTLTYNPGGTVAVKAHPRGVNARVGGGTCGLKQLPHSRDSSRLRRSDPVP